MSSLAAIFNSNNHHLGVNATQCSSGHGVGDLTLTQPHQVLALIYSSAYSIFSIFRAPMHPQRAHIIPSSSEPMVRAIAAQLNRLFGTATTATANTTTATTVVEEDDADLGADLDLAAPSPPVSQCDEMAVYSGSVQPMRPHASSTRHSLMTSMCYQVLFPSSLSTPLYLNIHLIRLCIHLNTR